MTCISNYVMSPAFNQRVLWKKFKKGNRQAFEAIYHEYYASLYFYALKMTANRSLAQECVQDLFVTLWKTRKGLADISSIKPYLFKSLNRLVARSAPSFYGGPFSTKPKIDIAFSPEDLLIEQQDDLHKRETLTTVLNSLPARQKEVIYLKYYEELSYAEIAETLHINYQSVINLMYKAFKRLRLKTALKRLIDDYNTFPFLILSAELL
ncbi:sigma-70 family RNA polymerase sigma factor [Fulvivirgaceae bacterium BMA12]|uniref:Sigma-70 family RNA polymerase sigma factor n=1 Tax=Agaribacillus aureus TaxID=3051825 RepID=A0ABT8L6D3_9BACT|nr:sigma-70 family RNA polymerase sigma factor [Fulvivirgaceae bacterium BMA12]